MIPIVVYRADGSSYASTTHDNNMVSQLERYKAIETWQVGFVQGHMAPKVKTVHSMLELLRKAGCQARVEITYHCQQSNKVVKEVLRVLLVGHLAEPRLIPLEKPALIGSEIVQQLDAFWGEYITVTYRLLREHEVAPTKSRPELLHHLRVSCR